MRVASLNSIGCRNVPHSSRHGRLGRRAGRSLPVLVLLTLLLPLFAACSPARKDVVVEGKGWRMTLPEVQSEYERLKGAGKFAEATAKERESFAQTLADKELLLRLAKQKHPKLDFRQSRLMRFQYEDWIHKDFSAARRAAFQPPEQDVASAAKLIAREAKAVGTLFATEEDARQTIEEVKNGANFQEVSLRRGLKLPPAVEGAGESVLQQVTLRVDDPQVHPPFFAEVFLRDLPVGGLTDPVQMRGGFAVLQVQSYTDVPEFSQPEFLGKTGSLLPNLLYYRNYVAWLDSLRTAAKFQIHPESYPVIRKRMVAFWDSLDALRTSGIEVDYGILPAPSVSSLTREERDTPVFDMFGKTETVAGFFRGLEEYDLSRWPFGDSLRMVGRIRERAERLLTQKEAENLGFDKSPAFAARMKRLNEQAFLTLYHDSLWNGEPTDEEIKAAYGTIPSSQILRPHRLSLSALIYPADLKERADQMRERLRQGGSASWEQLAPAEHGADSRILYVPPTRLLEPGRPCPIVAWEPLILAVTPLEEGAITEVVPGKDVYYIVKSVKVLAAGDMTIEEARQRLTDTVRGQKQDAMLEQVLDAARPKAGIKFHLDLLAQGAPSDSAKAASQPPQQGSFRTMTVPVGGPPPTGTPPAGAPGSTQPAGSGRP